MTHSFKPTHPLDLPEVRGHIFQFLTLHDLTVCSRVSQDWSQACFPLIWRKLVLAPTSPSDRVVEITSIRRYSHYVKTLQCSRFFGSTPETILASVGDVYFRNLEDLARNTPPQDQARFILCHRLTLVRLDLSVITMRSEQGQRESDQLWSVISACPKLESLKIERSSVTPKTWSVCWSLWSRLTHLRLRHVDFLPLLAVSVFDQSGDTIPQRPLGNMSEWLSQASLCLLPLKIKTLDLSHRPDMTRMGDDLALLKYCPDLETLIWRMKDNHPNPEHVGHYLAEQTRHCPKLVNVTVHFASQTDAVSSFLERNVDSPLQELGWPVGFFSEAALDLVRTKYATSLRSLDLWETDAPAGLAHRILCSLPALVNLSVRGLNHQHITNDPRPWVCLGLKRLVVEIFFEGSSLEGQNVILRRLGTLKSLRHLEVTTQQLLLFRLNWGLEHLATLQELQEIRLNCSQYMSEDDVRWMVDNWPRLDSVLTVLHPEGAMDSSLKSILRARGVKTELHNYDVVVN